MTRGKFTVLLRRFLSWKLVRNKYKGQKENNAAFDYTGYSEEK